MSFQYGIVGYIGTGIVNVDYGRKHVTGKKETGAVDAGEVWHMKGVFSIGHDSGRVCIRYDQSLHTTIHQ